MFAAHVATGRCRAALLLALGLLGCRGAPAPATPNDCADCSCDSHPVACQHREWARYSLEARDGATCLKELAQGDSLEPETSRDRGPMYWSFFAMLRARCMMLVGQCDAGRRLTHQAFDDLGPGLATDGIDAFTDHAVGAFCEGPGLAPRDQVLVAQDRLQWRKPDAAMCADAYGTIIRLRAIVGSVGDHDVVAKDELRFLLVHAPLCFARVGDCDAAFGVYRDAAREMSWERGSRAGAPAQFWDDDKRLRESFAREVPSCAER